MYTQTVLTLPLFFTSEATIHDLSLSSLPPAVTCLSSGKKKKKKKEKKENTVGKQHLGQSITRVMRTKTKKGTSRGSLERKHDKDRHRETKTTNDDLTHETNQPDPIERSEDGHPGLD